MDSQPVGATELVVESIHSLASTACRALRHKQKLYLIVTQSRDLCHQIHGLINRAELGDTTEEFLSIVDSCGQVIRELERYAVVPIIEPAMG